MSTVSVIEPIKSFQYKRLKVAAYARVSVEKELSEHSFKAQVDYYCKKINSNPAWVNAGVYADYGITGTKTSRPGFENLLKACESGQIDMIITKSISRFCRNTVDLLNTTRHLKDLGINVFFEKENIYSISSEGELMLTLLASFAQEESRSMSENCKWAIRKRFEQGIGNWYHLYGYKYENKEYIVIPEEANTIRLVFSLYLDGKTPHQIVKILDNKGIRTRSGNKFIYSRIFKILRQEKYAGNSLLQKTYRENYLTKKRMKNHGDLQMFYATETHPAIVSQDVFDAVQTEISVRASLNYLVNQKTNFSCLTGKIICGNCGHTYRRHEKSEHGKWKTYQWRCGTKVSKGASSCQAQNIPEKLLYSFIKSILEVDEVTSELVNSKIRQIIISSPCIATFNLTDGRVVTKKWEYNEKTKLHTEVA